MDVSYERIGGSLGSLLLLWTAIERSAREEVVRVHKCLPKSAHGIAAVLKCWESTVKDAQDLTTLGSLVAEALREAAGSTRYPKWPLPRPDRPILRGRRDAGEAGMVVLGIRP